MKLKIRDCAVYWIEAQPKHGVFSLSDMYNHIQSEHPNECDDKILTPDAKEPKWHKDARWALQDCKMRKQIKHVGNAKSARWQRL